MRIFCLFILFVRECKSKTIVNHQYYLSVIIFNSYHYLGFYFKRCEMRFSTLVIGCKVKWNKYCYVQFGYAHLNKVCTNLSIIFGFSFKIYLFQKSTRDQSFFVAFSYNLLQRIVRLTQWFKSTEFNFMTLCLFYFLLLFSSFVSYQRSIITTGALEKIVKLNECGH